MRNRWGAHANAYAFIATAYTTLSPPDDIKKDFIELMRDYVKIVKPHALLYPQEMRDMLESFENQYHCLSDPGLIPNESFEDFMDKRIYMLLDRLADLVAKRAEVILHKT